MRQGYEPDIFKKIFPRWNAFGKANLDNFEISEEDSDSDDSGSSDGATSKAKSTAAATDVASELAKDLTADQKKHIASYLPESVWLNF